MNKYKISIVIPSYNQGYFLEDALVSIFSDNINVEVFVMDGGSTDNSVSIIKRWEHRLAGWRSYADNGQSSAINEGIALGSAPYVAWLNSDDFYLSNGLSKLLSVLEKNPTAPLVYGNAYHQIENLGIRKKVWVEKFSEKSLSKRCIICQPATLIKRSVWEGVGGLDTSLKMSMDYDLWWKIFKMYGDFAYINDEIAVNRDHSSTKTNNHRRLHYRESMRIVKKYHGRVPLKWWLYQPYSVYYKGLIRRIKSS